MIITIQDDGSIIIEHPSLQEPLKIHPKDIFNQTPPYPIADGKWKTELHLKDERIFIFEYNSFEEAEITFMLLDLEVLG